jgi:N-acetylglucosaminyldiphosphoundecaprenol N-acetyl-beta-D-mannosaminyltransferase
MNDLMQLQKFDEIPLLGTRFHKLKASELIEYIAKAGRLDKKTIVGNVNIRAINFAVELPWYRNFLNQSDLVFCDGFGVILGAKFLGNSINYAHRMTCPDYIEQLALACQQKNVSLFLLAGKPGTVDKAISKLQQIAPNLRIKGHHGYFDKLGAENDSVIQEINQFEPGVLYVGFGMPMQEPWMTDYGLEWLSRLIIEPTRLWERYVIGNPLFFYRIMREKIRIFFKKSSKVISHY